MKEPKKQDYEKLLMDAAKRGEIPTIKKCLVQKVDIDTRDENGRTPIMHAFINGHIKAGIFLFNAGASIENQDVLGNNVLSICLSLTETQIQDKELNSLDIFRFFMKNGVHFSYRDIFGKGMVEKAIDYEKTDIALFFIERGVYASNEDLVRLHAQIKKNLLTPYFFQNEPDLTVAPPSLLNASSASLCADFLGRTPLMLAIQQKSFSMADFLLSYNPKITARDYSGASVFDYVLQCRIERDARQENQKEQTHAKTNKAMDVQKQIEDSQGAANNVEQEVHRWREYFEKVLDKIQKEDSRFNAKEAFISAIETNNILIADILLNQGVRLSQNILTTVLQKVPYIPLSTYKEVFIERLLTKGAQLNIADKKGRTALHHAVLANDTKTALYFMDQGAKPEGRDVIGRTIFEDLTLLTPQTLKKQSTVDFLKVLLFNKGGEDPFLSDEPDCHRMMQEAIRTEKWSFLEVLSDLNVYIPYLDKKEKFYNHDTQDQKSFVSKIVQKIKINNFRLKCEENIHRTPDLNTHKLVNVIQKDLNDIQQHLNSLIHQFVKIEIEEEKAYQKFINLAENEPYQSKLNAYTEQQKQADVQKEKITRMLQMFIREGGNINYQNAEGKTPLMWVIQQGALECAELLLDLGSDIRIRDKNQMDAMAYLVSSTNIGEQDFLPNIYKENSVNSLYLKFLKKGVDLEQKDRFGLSLIEKSFLVGNFDMAQKLFYETGYEKEHFTFEKQKQIVQGNRCLTLTEVLVENNWVHEGKDEKGRNLFLLALSAGKIYNAQILASFGEQIKGEDMEGNGGYHYLVDCALDANKALRSQAADVHEYLENQNHKEFKHLIQTMNMHEGNIEKKNCYGMSPVLYAISKGAYGVANILIENGASLETKDALGNHPLHWHAKNQYPTNIYQQRSYEKIQKLFSLTEQQRTDVNLLGDTPTQLCSRTNNYKLYGVILEEMVKTKLQLRDHDGRTPLMFAIMKGERADILRTMQNEDSMDFIDPAGRTALHYGALYGKADVCKKLIQMGADVFIKDQEGHTPMDIAIRSERNEVIATFIEMGIHNNHLPAVKEETMQYLQMMLKEKPHELDEETQKYFHIYLKHGRKTNKSVFDRNFIQTSILSHSKRLAGFLNKKKNIQGIVTRRTQPFKKDNGLRGMGS